MVWTYTGRAAFDDVLAAATDFDQALTRRDAARRRRDVAELPGA